MCCIAFGAPGTPACVDSVLMVWSSRSFAPWAQSQRKRITAPRSPPRAAHTPPRPAQRPPPAATRPDPVVEHGHERPRPCWRQQVGHERKLHERERDGVEHQQRPDLRRGGRAGSDDHGQYRQVVDGRQGDPQACHCRDPQRLARHEPSCLRRELRRGHDPGGQQGSHQQSQDADHDLDLGQREVCRLQ